MTARKEVAFDVNMSQQLMNLCQFKALVRLIIHSSYSTICFAMNIAVFWVYKHYSNISTAKSWTVRCLAA